MTASAMLLLLAQLPQLKVVMVVVVVLVSMTTMMMMILMAMPVLTTMSLDAAMCNDFDFSRSYLCILQLCITLHCHLHPYNITCNQNLQ
jgi:hypothetical protein